MSTICKSNSPIGRSVAFCTCMGQNPPLKYLGQDSFEEKNPKIIICQDCPRSNKVCGRRVNESRSRGINKGRVQVPLVEQ